MEKISIVDKILIDREVKNERTVAIARLVMISISSFFDVLAFFNIITFTETPPNITTISLDFFSFSFSLIVFLICLQNKFYKYLKFYTISFDYLILCLILTFDPSIQKGNELMTWTSLVAVLFLFTLNLIRFSKVGTLYAGFMSICIFIFINLNQTNNSPRDFFPMLLGLSFFLFIGYTITNSSTKLMMEANAKKMMERYLPHELISELYNNSKSLELGGKNTEVTILFSDIRSFTNISESMKPEETVILLNEYLSLMTEIIFENQGTIDKFIGDSIMTLFGAPLKKEDDSYRAVNTAISMIHSLKKFNEKFSNLEKPLEIGIGIHTGEVIAGNIGSNRRYDYTVIGDNVNLSSRIESLTKFYNCPILISETTYQKLILENKIENFLIREVDNVVVKGKSKSIKIFEVCIYFNDEEKLNLQNKIVNFTNGLQLYKEKKFNESKEIFKNIENDPLSKIYIQRIEQLLLNPPEENWTGVFVMENK